MVELITHTVLSIPGNLLKVVSSLCLSSFVSDKIFLTGCERQLPENDVVVYEIYSIKTLTSEHQRTYFFLFLILRRLVNG